MLTGDPFTRIAVLIIHMVWQDLTFLYERTKRYIWCIPVDSVVERKCRSNIWRFQFCQHLIHSCLRRTFKVQSTCTNRIRVQFCQLVLQFYKLESRHDSALYDVAYSEILTCVRGIDWNRINTKCNFFGLALLAWNFPCTRMFRANSCNHWWLSEINKNVFIWNKNKPSYIESVLLFTKFIHIYWAKMVDLVAGDDCDRLANLPQLSASNCRKIEKNNHRAYRIGKIYQNRTPTTQ